MVSYFLIWHGAFSRCLPSRKSNGRVLDRRGQSTTSYTHTRVSVFPNTLECDTALHHSRTARDEDETRLLGPKRAVSILMHNVM